MGKLMAVLGSLLGMWLIINVIGAFIVGAIAKQILPGKENLGWLKTIALGFLGGILGKIVFGLLGWSTGLVMGFVASVLGAFVLLVAYQSYTTGKAKGAGAKPAS